MEIDDRNARPKIFFPSDFAPTMMTPVRVSGFNDLILPLNSMSAPTHRRRTIARRQPHRVAGDGAGITCPVRDEGPGAQGPW